MSQGNEEGNANGDDYNSGMWSSNTTTFPPTSYKITYTYTPKTEEGFIQPHTTPVAHFTSAANEEFNELIDISPSFIVYAVKNNLVRVIDRRNALRTLLRGHVGLPVTCLKFFSNKSIKGTSSSSDVLATVGGGGKDRQTIFVWRLYCSSEKNEIISEKLLEIRFDYARMIVWHPTNPNQLFIVSDDVKKSSVFIETTRLITVASSLEGDVQQHAVCECKEKDLGNAVSLGSGDVVVDVDWNECDSKWVLVALRDCGEVQLWDLSGWVSGGVVKKSGEGVLVKDVSKCAFVNHKKGSFITGSDKNREVTLWSSFLSDDKPVPLQVWSFGSIETPPPSICFNLSVCSGGSNSNSSYLLLADKNVGNLFAIHVEDDRFASFTPFAVIHPVVSWSVMTTSSSDPSANGHFDICLFCVQTKAVQMLRLKHKMLAPSSTIASTTLPSYLSIESQGEVMMAAMKDDTADIEEYDDEDEDDVDYDYSDDNKEEDYAAPPAASLPPPGLEGFSDEKKNAFSNWLGSLAATPSSAPNILPPPPKADSVPSNTVTPSAILRPDDKLLSPTRFINKVEEDKVPNILKNTEPKKEDVKPRILEKEKPEKSNNKPSTKPSSSSTPSKKKQQQPTPNPPQLTILKREDNNPPAPPPTINNNTPFTSNNMEELTRKLFKKQETFIQNEIQRSIRQEIQTMLLPSLTRSLTQVMDSSITKPLKDSIQKSNDKKEGKHRAKEIGEVLVEGVKSPIVDAFHQTMREVMIPAFEAATQQMFTQVSKSLEVQLQVSQKESKDKSIQIASLESKIDSMSLALESLSVEVTQLRTLVVSLDKNGITVKDDISMKQPKQVTQEELLILLNNQRYEEAFTKALSASSAEMVVFCCKNTNSSILFELNDSNSLSQPILLCLMQQLGSVIPTADTSDLMEVLSWLQDICVVLEPNNKNIENHIAEVLRQLVNNIKAKMAEGDMTFRRPLQMLLQVIRGIGIV